MGLVPKPNAVNITDKTSGNGPISGKTLAQCGAKDIAAGAAIVHGIGTPGEIPGAGICRIVNHAGAERNGELSH